MSVIPIYILTIIPVIYLPYFIVYYTIIKPLRTLDKYSQQLMKSKWIYSKLIFYTSALKTVSITCRLGGNISSSKKKFPCSFISLKIYQNIITSNEIHFYFIFIAKVQEILSKMKTGFFLKVQQTNFHDNKINISYSICIPYKSRHTRLLC